MAAELRAELLADVGATVGESPLWDEGTGRVWWVDIPRGELHFLDLSTGEDETRREFPGPLGCVLPTSAGGLALGLRDRVMLTDREVASEVEVSVDHLHSNARLNDGGCSPAGHLYIGSVTADRTTGAGQLHRVGPDLVPRVELSGVTVSNGIGFTRDGATAYYVDSPTERVDAFDVDPDSGSWSGRRTAFGIDGPGRPDGLTVDSEDGVWVALWGGGEVRRYTPDGRLDRRLRLPVDLVTSCTFVGPDLSTLLVTTASKGLTSAQRREQPFAGAVFVADAGVQGLLPDVFRSQMTAVGQGGRSGGANDRVRGLGACEEQE